MKKITREILWVCLPLFIVGGGVVIDKALHPPPDPDAKIQLKVEQKSSSNQSDREVFLAWEARVSDGPSLEFMPVYNQAIWAVGKDWQSQLSAEPVLPKISATQVSSWGGGGWSPRGWDSVQTMIMSKEVSVPIEDIPWGTRKLEWRGNFAVAPSEKHQSQWLAVNAAKLRQIAQLPNAVSKSCSFSVPISPSQSGPIYYVKKANQQKDSVRVSYLLSEGTRVIYRRLVARDGKKQRLLWEDPNKNAATPYWSGEAEMGSLGATEENTIDFDLTGVSAKEEIVFIIDAVYKRNAPPASTNPSQDEASLQTIEKLEKQGWYRESRAIVVKPSK